MKLHQTKDFCTGRNYQQNKKRIEWQKIFANNMSDKGLT